MAATIANGRRMWGFKKDRNEMQEEQKTKVDLSNIEFKWLITRAL